MESIKTRPEIAKEYGVTPRTLQRWIKKVLPVLLHVTLTPSFQKMIYEKFGYPKCVDSTEYLNQ